MDAGEVFTIDKFAQLLIASYYPERTNLESAIIRDFLAAHLYDFDRVAFSVRVGQGLAPDPTHDPAINKTKYDSTRKRIDVLAWQGDLPWIIECKYRVNPAALGQLHTYSLLWQQEHPHVRPPKLVAIGRYSDADTLTALDAHGVDVYLYPPAAGSGGPTNGSVPADNAAPSA